MSSRRTTRAASKQASSRGASPAISEATGVAATPRRTSVRRAATPGVAPTPQPSLVAVGTRTSTSYGTNTVPEAAPTVGPIVSDSLNNVLSGILDPIPEASSSSSEYCSCENRTLLTHDAEANSRPPAGRGGKRSRVSPDPSAPNRSFHHESAIFSQAGLDDSPVPDSPELNGIPEEEEEEKEDPGERQSIDSGDSLPESFDAQMARQAEEEEIRRQELYAIALRTRRHEIAVDRNALGEATIGDVYELREFSRGWFWILCK